MNATLTLQLSGEGMRRIEVARTPRFGVFPYRGLLDLFCDGTVGRPYDLLDVATEDESLRDEIVTYYVALRLSA